VADNVVGCAAGHRFDVAKHGYLSLLGKGSRTDTGDSADMVAARAVFLGAGHYRPLADALAVEIDDGPVLEVGAGTGYYLAAAVHRLADGHPESDVVGVALDASRYAARRAAGVHHAVGSIVADAWSRLPVRDAGIATVLSVFAPRDAAEIARVLAPGGRLVVATPEPDHLTEIRRAVGLLTVDEGKADRLVETFAGRLRSGRRVEVREMMHLGPTDIDALVRMGPTARHITPDALAAAVSGLPASTRVTLAASVTVLTRDG